ncbi:minor capsid protein [Streptomyces sp. NBC_00249]|uniref:minor capsid protein n=1 Tax=Streptomyces sp. NBC_00249 TaxID=2975690 RepID=UPI0022515566|nr:minor capsid protein [Streptomyces sp. NBC_00249]MCX5197227.1 minor capsid protein [Streptomyces sp. NBC_00249]
MADLLDGLARYLAARGHGTYDPTGASGSIFIEALPSSPDTCVVLTVYDDGGEADTRLGYDDVPLQVRVRGTTDPRVSRQLAQAIRSELHGLGETVLPDGTGLILARANHAVAALGTDENRRHEHVVNLKLHVRSVTTHRV